MKCSALHALDVMRSDSNHDSRNFRIADKPEITKAMPVSIRWRKFQSKHSRGSLTLMVDQRSIRVV